MIFLSESNLQIINELGFKNTDTEELLKRFTNKNEFIFNEIEYNLDKDIPSNKYIAKYNNKMIKEFNVSYNSDMKEIKSIVNNRMYSIAKDFDIIRANTLGINKPISLNDYEKEFNKLIYNKNELWIDKNKLKKCINEINNYDKRKQNIINSKKELENEFNNNELKLLKIEDFIDKSNGINTSYIGTYCSYIYNEIKTIRDKHLNLYDIKLNLLEKEYRQNLKIIAKAKKMIK